jgi:hypothetical protein
LNVKSLADLREPDVRTLRFGPMGLETGRLLRPESAAQYRQEIISRAALVPAVAKSTRGTFERLQSTYAYGVLSYEIFTVVDDLAQLVIEQALRDRFIEFHDGMVRFQDADGEFHEVAARTFEGLYDAIHSGNRLCRPHKWRLPLRRTGQVIYFDGMLDSLLRWARGEGLLRGQRNRRREPLLKAFRNRVAHGSGDHLVTPVDTARDISDAAEIINQLWGSPTPGGRLFPAPIQREVQVVAWAPGRVMTGPVGHDLPPDEFADWSCVLVQAVLGDERLDRYDAQYETTLYPCDLLWGPGTWPDASAWLSEQDREADEVETLDRLFVLQHHEERLYLPRNLDVATGLTEETRQGRWHLIRADFPDDALAHARGAILGQCQGAGPCEQCAAESVGIGTWQEAMELTATAGTSVTPCRPHDFRVPTLRSAPRYLDVRQG